MTGKVWWSRVAHIMVIRQERGESRRKKKEEKQRERERERVCTSRFPPSSLVSHLGPAFWVVPLTFRAGLPLLVSPLCRCPHRHTRKCASLIS
jgi:hypothetical protein